jgi:hypothetical protein
MRVNLNKVAEQIVPEYSYKQFVDNVSDIILPPLYRGALRTFYPSTIKRQKSGDKLRRYIFNYNSNGSFDFITTRIAQRNGGRDIRPEEIQVNVTITDPSNNFAVLRSRNFNKIFNNLYTFGQVTRIIYVNQIYYWQERLAGEPVFSNIYYSSPTTNVLENADKEGDVNWFEFGTNKYVIANNTGIGFYNNNTLVGLNNWPIQNEEVRVKQYTIQDGQAVNVFSNDLVTETRPTMLDDAYLHKCFNNVNLDAYDTAFVDVLWKEYTNRTTFRASRPMWIGEPFTVPVLKGRVYRVGTLAKSNGIGEFDVVTYAQRTRIKTTRTKRGGNSVYV